MSETNAEHSSGNPNSERVKRWREKKPNRYREYQKAYMREYRARKKREREDSET